MYGHVCNATDKAVFKVHVDGLLQTAWQIAGNMLIYSIYDVCIFISVRRINI